MPDTVREPLESRLDAGLSRVRIHTSPESAEAAEAAGARAYTADQDIHLAANEYSPAGLAGMHLLAHEIAHTMQNRDNAFAAPQMQLSVSMPHDPAELEADRVTGLLRPQPPSGVPRPPC